MRTRVRIEYKLKEGRFLNKQQYRNVSNKIVTKINNSNITHICSKKNGQ